MGIQWESFNKLKNQINDFISGITKKVTDKDSTQCNYAGVQRLSECIEAALSDMAENNATKERLHDLGRSLMTSDSSQLVAVQNALTAADGSWDRAQNMLYELQTKFTSVSSLWKQCNDLREELLEAIEEAEENGSQVMKLRRVFFIWFSQSFRVICGIKFEIVIDILIICSSLQYR